MVQVIDEEGQNLTTWEVNFIASLIDKPPRSYSLKQIEIITRIYDEKC
jgi:hypothetical protein